VCQFICDEECATAGSTCATATCNACP
jgi:hypothetical protein